MKALQLLLFCCVFFVQSGKAQNYVAYHNLCNEAEVLIRKGELLIAQGMLIQAISLVPKPKAVDYFNLAKCYSQANQHDSTLKYIDLALTNSENMRALVRKHYLWFDPILTPDEWTDIQERIKHPTTRPLTAEEEKIMLVYDRINELPNQYNKFLYDSIYSKFPVDTVLRNNYRDSMLVAEMKGSEIFDSLCQAIGHFPDSHPSFEYRNYFTTRNFPLEWFEKNEAFLFSELQSGRFQPGRFIEFYLVGKYDSKRIFAVKNPSDLTDEMLELMEKYGVTFDWNTRWLRENQSWPYD